MEIWKTCWYDGEGRYCDETYFTNEEAAIEDCRIKNRSKQEKYSYYKINVHDNPKPQDSYAYFEFSLNMYDEILQIGNEHQMCEVDGRLIDRCIPALNDSHLLYNGYSDLGKSIFGFVDSVKIPHKVYFVMPVKIHESSNYESLRRTAFKNANKELRKLEKDIREYWAGVLDDFEKNVLPKRMEKMRKDMCKRNPEAMADKLISEAKASVASSPVKESKVGKMKEVK